LLTGYLLFLSLRFTVHYYDSYEYLNNARQLIGIETHYDIARAPFFTFLLLPFAWLSKFFHTIMVIERAPYFLMTLIGAAAVLATWRVLGLALPNHLAMLGALALACNPLYLHYWPFLMPEALTALLLACFWWALARKQAELAGVVLAAILSLRYQLVLIVALGFIFDLLNQRDNLRAVIKRWIVIGIISLAIFSLLHYLIFYFGLSRLGFWAGFRELYERIHKFSDRGADTLWQMLTMEIEFLYFFETAPILLIAGVGIGQALWRREKMDQLFLLWFWGIFFSITFTFRLNLKEARYMIPALPALYYFFLVGIKLIWQWLTRFLTGARAPLRAGLLIAFSLAVALSPIIKAGNEILRLNDDCYFKPLAHDIGSFLNSHLPAGQPAYWAGSYFTIEPADYQFNKAERIFFFDLFVNAMSFYTDRACYSNFSESFIYQDARGALVVVNKNLGKNALQLRDGSAPIPVTVQQILRQIKFRNSGKTVDRLVDGYWQPFALFISEDGKEEIYLAELGNLLIFDRQQHSGNIILQLGYRGEHLPEYADSTLFAIPGQMSRSARHSIAAIDFILISELSPSLASFS
jgi:hypothetical protein